MSQERKFLSTETGKNTIPRGRSAREEKALTFAELVSPQVREIEQGLNDKYKVASDEDAKYEIEQQKASLHSGIEWVVWNTFSVKLDSEGNVVAFLETFSESRLSIHKGKTSGFL